MPTLVRHDPYTLPIQIVSELKAALDQEGVQEGEEYVVLKKDRYINMQHAVAGEPTPAIRAEVAGPSRRTDPHTSKKAGTEGVGRFGTLRHQVFMAIAVAGERGATATELEQATGIDWRSMTPRVGELKKWGYVTTNGKTRKGDRGADQDVCVLTDKGRREYETTKYV